MEATLADAGFDAVMHFAASLDVNESVHDPVKYYENNVVNTVRLLRCMRDHGVRRLIFSSTCATYGIPSRIPVVESDRQAPVSPYGRTKLAIEGALRDSVAGWGLGSCALRYFNAAGASTDATLGEDHEPEIHLIPVVLEVARGRRSCVKVFGADYPTSDGTCVRDYVHVEDLASAHRLALESQETRCFRCFNIGTGVGVSVQQVLDAARMVTRRPIPALTAGRREGDPPELYADSTKLRHELGWCPKFMDIEDIIETAWHWHQTHPHGFVPVHAPDDLGSDKDAMTFELGETGGPLVGAGFSSGSRSPH